MDNAHDTVLLLELTESNEEEYNYLKAAEELNELSEVLLKKVIKKGGPKEPADNMIIEEIGDVYIRLEILSNMFGNQAVQDRISDKLNKYRQYIKEGKYKGRI